MIVPTLVFGCCSINDAEVDSDSDDDDDGDNSHNNDDN